MAGKVGFVGTLTPLNTLPKEEARKIQSMGGTASAIAKRKRKTLKEELLILLASGNTQERVSIALIDKALDGDVRAYQALESSIGEKQNDKIENINVDIGLEEYRQLTLEELKKLAGK